MKQRREFLRNTLIGGVGISLSNMGTKFSKSSKKRLVACDMTTQDFYGEGPFYTENPPMLDNFKLAGENEPGQRMIIAGRVFNLECSEYIPETIIDVWHANDAGQYDNNGYDLRGYTKTNEQGFYLFETIKPGKYLNGIQFRPSHIHYKVKPPQFPLLTTQLYFEGDTDIPLDRAASITTGQYDATNRIISLTMNSDGILEGTFDIVIDGRGISVGTNDLHLDKGMIYQVSPNPFEESLEINYGVFKKSKVGLYVFDMQGRQVAVLEEEIKTPQKYTAVWQPQDAPQGYYFVAIKINDLQVHYEKVLRN